MSVTQAVTWKAGQRLLDDFLVEGHLGRGGMGDVYLARSEATGQRFAVKPGNVLMTAEGVPKLSDFGLARARARAETPRPPPDEPTGGRQSLLGRLGAWLGSGSGGTTRPAGDPPAGQDTAGLASLVSWAGMTPAYCSPEQAQGMALSRATDVWSWGASVLEMFTGGVIWPSGTAVGRLLERYAEAAEADRLIRRAPGSRQAQAIDDLIGYEEAMSIYSGLVASGRKDLETDLATLCIDKAFIHENTGDTIGALALYDKAIAIRERLVHQEGRRELANDLAMCYLNKATPSLGITSTTSAGPPRASATATVIVSLCTSRPTKRKLFLMDQSSRCG